MIETITTFLTEQIAKNDLVAGGAVLAAMAFVLNQVKSWPFKIIKWMRLMFITEMDIPDRSETFKWVSEWLGQHQYMTKAKRITVEARRAGTAAYSPAPGRHLLWFKGRPMILRRARREGTGDNAHRAFREKWVIAMFGSRKRVEDFITECRLTVKKDADEFIKVYEVGEHGYWTRGTKKRKRDLTSVILGKGLRDTLADDVNNFIESKDWYNKMMIPYRRGYLLTGPPGNGKSSIVTAIASEFDLNINVLNLGQVGEDELSTLMGDMKENSILLLEDIDCAFIERENKQAISLSNLLNLLDGVSAAEGRIVFMTTNHRERLDAALVRPGRIDLELLIDNASPEQVAALYRRFYDKDPSVFVAELGDTEVSMAALQGHFLCYKDSPEDALEHIEELSCLPTE